MGNWFLHLCVNPEVTVDDEHHFENIDLKNKRIWVSQKGSPSCSQQDDFIFLTWNILADGQKYATGSNHAYCPIEHRLWNVRLKKIVIEIRRSGADIVALQEAKEAMWPMIKENLAQEYDGYFESRAPGKPSVAMLWKRERFDRLEEHLLSYISLASARLPDTKLWTKIHSASSPKIGIVLLLRTRQSKKLVIASCSHLHWNPKEPDRKLGEFFLHCQELAKLELQWLSKYKYDNEIPVLIGIDSNSIPMKFKPDSWDTIIPPGGLTSGVYELATVGSVPKEHPHHPARTLDDVTPTLTLASPFKSAYSEVLGHEPKWTTKAMTFAGTLDYVFYRGPIVACEVLAPPYNNEEEAERSNRIPSEHFPSDHLSLAARFNFVSESPRIVEKKENM